MNISRNPNSWILDNNIINFIYSNQNQFINYRAFKVFQYIYNINLNNIIINKINIIYIFDKNENKCIIKLVLYIFKLKNDLFSLIYIILMNWCLVFENDDCIIIHDDFYFHLFIKNNLY